MLAQPSESGSVCDFAGSTRPRKYNRKASDCKRLMACVLAQSSNVLFLQSYNVLFSNKEKGTERKWMNY
jgi:hypothetical protein